MQNRIAAYFSPAAGFSPSGTIESPKTPQPGAGFMLVPSNLFPVAGHNVQDEVPQDLRTLYERAFNSAQRQAQSIPTNRLTGFWKPRHPR